MNTSFGEKLKKIDDARADTLNDRSIVQIVQQINHLPILHFIIYVETAYNTGNIERTKKLKYQEIFYYNHVSTSVTVISDADRCQ